MPITLVIHNVVGHLFVDLYIAKWRFACFCKYIFHNVLTLSLIYNRVYTFLFHIYTFDP